MTQTKITLIQAWAELQHYAARWTALACVEGSGASVFQTFEWHDSWWKSFGGPEHNDTPYVLLAEKDGRLVGVAPMMISRESRLGLPRRVLRFIGSRNFASDYCDFLVDAAFPDVAQELVEWVGAHKSHWHRVDFFNLPSHSPRRLLIEENLRSSGTRFVSNQYSDAPTRVLGDPVSDAEALNKKSLKRHLNYFQKSGELTFQHLQSREEILGHLNTFFQQHIDRRALTSDKSQFLDPRQKDFYRALVNGLPAAWLRFSVVLYQGKPLAFHFGFEFGRRFIWYKPTFNVEFLRKSPGEVLLRFLLKHAMDAKLEEFDFTIGNEGFKYRFSNLVRSNHQIIAFSRGWEHQLFIRANQLRAGARQLRSYIRGLKPAPAVKEQEA